MSDYRAAILTGPRGPFVVVELTERQRAQLTADDRQALTGCVRKHHGGLPVVFVVASPSTLHAIHGQEMEVDLHDCLSTHRGDGVAWQPFAHPAESSGSVAV